jgi:mannose-6-phosphate isomerase-like protein (cupin superfamily)
MELVAVVGLVLLFFGIFLGTLNFVFPTGTSFRELMGRGIPDSSRDQTDRDAVVLEQPLVLSKITNMVKHKRSSDIVWTASRVGLNLYDRDAVQTFKAASVLLTIDKGENYLELGENSLIIIGRNEKEVKKDEKKSEARPLLVMVEGQLSGRLTTQDGEEISTPAAVIRVPAGGKGPSGSEFKVSINKDQSSTFTILKGIAEVVAQGQAVLVKENQTTTVRLNEPPPAPHELPRHEVTLTDPMNNQVIYYRDIPPRVKFVWRPLPEEREYRILVAKDSAFSALVVDEWVKAPFFVLGNLKAGAYFWKVVLRTKSTCETRQLRMVHNTKAPTLLLETIPRIVRADRYTIKGTTDAGARVVIEGGDVKTDEVGRFKYTIRLRQGVNIVVVEAVDKAGNITYGTVRIFAKN